MHSVQTYSELIVRFKCPVNNTVTSGWFKTCVHVFYNFRRGCFQLKNLCALPFITSVVKSDKFGATFLFIYAICKKKIDLVLCKTAWLVHLLWLVFHLKSWVTIKTIVLSNWFCVFINVMPLALLMSLLI